MLNSTALAVAGARTDTAAFHKIAEVARDRAMHLSVFVTGVMPAVPVHAYPMSPYATFEIPQAWQDLVDQQTRALSGIADVLKAMLEAERVEADVRVLCSDQSGLQDAIARRGLSVDVALLDQGLREDEVLFRTALRAALFDSATGVLLNGTEPSRCLGARRVFVAWNDGVQAARAVRAALPILRGAEEVALALFDPVMTAHGDGEQPGSDAARWLTHHGCKVTVQQYPSGGVDVAEAIRLRATEAGSDLVVMGAYEHARMRQIIFGGTTRTMIEQTAIPLLLAH